MRIHTNLLVENLHHARRDSGAPLFFHTVEQHRSTTRERSFDVRLEGSGGRNNTGLYGAGDYKGATWDEWGAFLGALFAMDPAAWVGTSAKAPIYRDATDFHRQTGDRFAKNEQGHHLPLDTHPRHRWQHVAGYPAEVGDLAQTCAKCSATVYRQEA